MNEHQRSTLIGAESSADNDDLAVVVCLLSSDFSHAALMGIGHSPFPGCHYLKVNPNCKLNVSLASFFKCLNRKKCSGNTSRGSVLCFQVQLQHRSKEQQLSLPRKIAVPLTERIHQHAQISISDLKSCLRQFP